MKTTLLLTALACTSALTAQNYTSYFTGSATDIVTTPTGGICMMGGATESDEAMQWFLARAAGGDILVLRASGSNGYNDYLYSELGVPVNSVETIVCNNAASANEAYIHQKIQQAEAIWFAGGDQWNYVSYWRNTPIDSLINDALENRNIVIGGTSAGMAILGKYYFSAQNGSVTSATALANPYDSDVTVDGTEFLHNTFLENVVTDTHYDSPDRKGRHVTFMARMVTDHGVGARGIACEEYTAVCIPPDGIAKIYGDAGSDDYAYFINMNCELANALPETCTPGTPLTWSRNDMALKVYVAKGNQAGSVTFDLNHWLFGSGGDWEYWAVNNGVLTTAPTTQPDCPLSVDEQSLSAITIFPNPATDIVTVISELPVSAITVLNAWGQTVQIPSQMTFSVADLPAGIYFVEALVNGKKTVSRFVREE